MSLKKNAPGIGADGSPDVIFHKPTANHHPVKNQFITRAVFDKRRIPRRLALEIANSKLPNLHPCGLANYI